MSIIRNGNVEFKKVPCRPVDFKKVPCHPVDFKKLLCRMSLRGLHQYGCISRVVISLLLSHIQYLYHMKAELGLFNYTKYIQINGLMPVLSNSEFENYILSLYFFNKDVSVDFE